jgi:hypothetical protein
VGTEPVDFCREIERYLCQKNDGHLIRIVGPSFELVSGWAAGGVPFKVACRGIDRCFERYYAKGPRRRPVKIDFCEADILDAFDEWRRATGVRANPQGGASRRENEDDAGGSQGEGGAGGSQREGEGEAVRRGPSLRAHVERALRRLTSARAGGAIDERFDALLDRVGTELDAARRARGAARHALIERLDALDRELLDAARSALDAETRAAIVQEAEEELSAFRARARRPSIGWCAIGRACRRWRFADGLV